MKPASVVLCGTDSGLPAASAWWYTEQSHARWGHWSREHPFARVAYLQQPAQMRDSSSVLTIGSSVRPTTQGV